MPGRLAQSDTRVAFPIVPTCGQVYVPGQMNSGYPLEVGHGCHHFEIHIVSLCGPSNVTMRGESLHHHSEGRYSLAPSSI